MSLRRSTPSAQGVDAAGLLAFVDAAEQGGLGLHSLMVARHGQVVAEGWWSPYSADRVHLLYSCSKSFTAAAVGLLVDAGRVRLDDPVFDHLPMGDLATPADAIDPRWGTVLVEHCLSMTVGHPDDAWARATEGSYDGDEPVDVDWLDLILRHPPELEPGTVFAYNQVATYLLARMVEQVSGERLLDFLRPRLFEPFAIDEVGTHTDTAGARARLQRRACDDRGAAVAGAAAPRRGAVGGSAAAVARVGGAGAGALPTAASARAGW